MSMPILATKLYIPLPQPNVVLRPRLIEQLNEGLHRKLTLISASAGSGKTTLVSEWIGSSEQRVARLSLDEGDNDPTRFLAYLIAAIQTIAPNIGLATACLVLFAALELAISWPNYAALIGLSGQYASATTDTHRAIFIAGADYVSALLATPPLVAIYTILVPGIGIFISGFVMLKGIFGKSSAYLGVVTGIFALIASVGPFLVSALDVAIIFVSLLTTLWFLLAGYRLTRLAQQ